MNRETERDLVGAAISDPRITASVKITADMFEQLNLGAIWQAIEHIHADGNTPDPSLIMATATRSGYRLDHSMLVELVGRGLPVNAEAYAAEVIEAHRQRELLVHLTQARQALTEGGQADDVARALLTTLGTTGPLEEAADQVQTLDEFVDQQLGPVEWVVPGLLARGDRLVLTGEEGGGKSVLMRQVACCAAAGWHPFAFTDHPARRVLVVDLENPLRIMRDKFEMIRDALRSRGRVTGDRLWIHRHPQGLDLSRPKDRLLLHHFCQLVNPDLLVIGPAYKLNVSSADQSRDEDMARRITAYLDELREQFGFALILEHHSPQQATGSARRNVRPIGSSLWLRWPEFGFGLSHADPVIDPGGGRRRVVDVVPWRGARDERPWPEQLEQASALPWADTNPSRWNQWNTAA